MGKFNPNKIKAFTSILFVIVMLASMTIGFAAENPALAAPISSGLSISVAPLELVPGQAGYIHVGGGFPLDVTASLDDQPLEVFWSEDGYKAVFSFGLDAIEGSHVVKVDATDHQTGITASQTAMVIVSNFTYQTEQLAIPFRLQPLLDEGLNQQELDRLSEIYVHQSAPAELQWPFALPVAGAIVTSRYGGNRVYNGGVLSARHTGVDFRRIVGEPVLASANGTVVLAQLLDIRGNVIVIDHGYGVFSQYAHLSQVMVRPGDFVLKGQVIGLAGATGRTNGPHLHFEIIVNGNPVDPVKWLSLTPNFIPPREATPRP
jgi:murein DD-endopeptidase MepM/ murein hydrolase activator NlpD